ncbi:hypothetical protein, partial [Streptomyces sp. NPDC001889]
MSAEPIAADLDVDETVEAVERPRLVLVHLPGPIASLWSDLRPYLPTRSQIAGPFRGVQAGARVLAVRGWAWVRADGWIWDGWTRLGAVAGTAVIGAPVIWTTVADAAGVWAPYLPPIAVICACAAARWHAPAVRTERGESPGPVAAVDDSQEDQEHDGQGGGLDEPEDLTLAEAVG